jgi:hypothetical protein
MKNKKYNNNNINKILNSLVDEYNEEEFLAMKKFIEREKLDKLILDNMTKEEIFYNSIYIQIKLTELLERLICQKQ